MPVITIYFKRTRNISRQLKKRAESKLLCHIVCRKKYEFTKIKYLHGMPQINFDTEHEFLKTQAKCNSKEELF